MSARTLAGGVVHAEHRDDITRTACGRVSVLSGMPLEVTCRVCLGDVDYHRHPDGAPLTRRTRVTYYRGGRCV